MEHYSHKLYPTFNRDTDTNNINISLYNEIVDKLNAIESIYIKIYPTFLISKFIYIRRVGNKLFFGMNDNYKNYAEGIEIVLKYLKYLMRNLIREVYYINSHSIFLP